MAKKHNYTVDFVATCNYWKGVANPATNQVNDKISFYSNGVNVNFDAKWAVYKRFKKEFPFTEFAKMQIQKMDIEQV